MSASSVLAALFLVAAGAPGPARAQHPGLEIVGVRDANGCVAETALRAHLDRYLRVHKPIDVEIVVRMGADPIGFDLRRDGAFVAQRRFEVLPAGCEARLDALAIAIAVAVEHAVGPEHASIDQSQLPVAGAEQPSSEQPDAATSQPEPAAVEAEAKPDASEARSDSGQNAEDSSERDRPSEPLALSVAAFAGGGVLIQVLPKPAPLLHLGAELRLGPVFAVSLAGLYAPEVEIRLAGGSVSSWLLGARALGCAGTSPEGLRLEGCAGAAGGAMSSSGEGVALQKRSEVTVGWLAGVLRVAASYPAAGRFGARLALDGQLNVVKPGVRIERPESEDDAVRVAENVGLAASLELWLALR